MRGLSFFGETLVNCYVGFEAVEEKVSRICLFNQESSELILGTSLGSIWKVDIFDDLTEPALSESGKEEESGREGTEYMRRCRENPYRVALRKESQSESQQLYKFRESELMMI